MDGVEVQALLDSGSIRMRRLDSNDCRLAVSLFVMHLHRLVACQSRDSAPTLLDVAATA